MNDKGDFYIGNTKISSSSGQQTTFDIPIPTITGEDPNRLSAVFDEVIVKERLLVEGGSSKQILSQFDGPVTFNGDITNNKELKSPGKIRITNNEQINSGFTQGSFITLGGAGVEKDLRVKGTAYVDGGLAVLGNTVLGDATADEIKINGQFSTSLIPSDNSRNLGSTANKWNELHAITLYGDGSNLTGIDATALKIKMTDTNGQQVVRTIAQADRNGLVINRFNADASTPTPASLAVGSIVANIFGDIGSPNGTVILDNGTGNGSDSTYSGTSAKVDLTTEKSIPNLNITGDDTCFPLFSKDQTGSQTLHTNPDFKFDADSDTLSVGGDLIAGKFLHLSGTASNSGDIHTHGGHDGIAVIQNTAVLGSTINNVVQNNQIRIAGKNTGGSNVTIASFNVETIGSSDVPILRCDGDIVAFNSSDINLKENINVIPNALDKINAISGNTFNWKGGQKNNDVGVIAQEVEALGLPGITTTRDDGTKAVRYEKLIPILIEAVKELSAKVTALENK